MVERCIRIAEVWGSIPHWSTKKDSSEDESFLLSLLCYESKLLDYHAFSHIKALKDESLRTMK